MHAFTLRPIYAITPSFLTSRHHLKLLHWLLVVVVLLSQVVAALPEWHFGGQRAPVTDAILHEPETAGFDIHAYPSVKAQTGAIQLQSEPSGIQWVPATELPGRDLAWQGNPEIVERRDAFRRHYDLGNGKALATVSPRPQHYQDAEGQWRAIDARLGAVDNGYVTSRNTLAAS